MKTKQVLIISNPTDEHTAYVTEHLHRLGINPILFYPEKFGKNMFFALNQNMDKQNEIIAISTPEGELVLNEIDSIWYRRPRLVSFESEILEHESMEFARDEWKSALESTYALTQKPLWVSHPDRLREAARKPLQLKIAREVGLNIPRTLITNNPDKAKEFYDLCNGKIIVKATGNGWVYSQNGDDVYYVLTNRPSSTDIQAVDEIALAPVTFQEEIPKEYEIRVNIVGQQILAVRIDSQKSEVSKLDWRRYDVGNTPYSYYTLPSEIENKCLKLTKLLGLEFGAIDLIREPTGKYTFLEINGNGQFLWAEQLSGVKIGETLANLLAGIVPPLKSISM